MNQLQYLIHSIQNSPPGLMPLQQIYIVNRATPADNSVDPSWNENDVRK